MLGPAFRRVAILPRLGTSAIVSLLFFAASGGAVYGDQRLQRIEATNGTSDDRFGRSVAISGEVVVIGAYGDDEGGTDSGAAEVFRLNGEEWKFEAKLMAGDAAEDEAEFERFGISVAVAADTDGSDDTVVIGATFAKTGAGPTRGAAYVFTKVDGAWVYEAKLVADDGAEFDRFGISVAVSGDTAVIGADNRDSDSGEANSGAAYVFTRTDGEWTQTEKLVASDGLASDFFGFSVALADDDFSGDTTVIGAYGHDADGTLAGRAYVFTRTVGVWDGGVALTPSVAKAFNRFGISVALSGDTAMVGTDRRDGDVDETISGTAYLFTRTSEGWDEPTQETLNAGEGEEAPRFGRGVALSHETAAVGTASDNGGPSDSVYIFKRTDSGWNNIPAKLSLPPDEIGPNVALSGDIVVIGAEGLDLDGEFMGAVYVPEPDALVLRLVGLATLGALASSARRQRRAPTEL